jgi:hypothetical protein
MCSFHSTFGFGNSLLWFAGFFSYSSTIELISDSYSQEDFAQEIGVQ